MPPKNRIEIAVVEDDPVMGASLVQGLSLEGYEVSWLRTVKDARDHLGKCQPSVILCDIRLPDGTGDMLFEDTSGSCQSQFLFMTAYGEIDQAVRLIRTGAADYVTKPFGMDTLLRRVHEMVESGEKSAVDGSLGVSSAAQSLESALRGYASQGRPVLLTGETGVGKEYCARLLHARSPLADGPFISVNCTLLPPGVLERELFDGAMEPDGGDPSGVGSYVERARNGTLFLENLEQLNVELQTRLVEVLEGQAAQRRSDPGKAFNGQLVFSSRRELRKLVATNTLSVDLYTLVGDRRLHIPPLRDRPEDIPWLIDRFLSEFRSLAISPIRGMSAAAEAEAIAYDWPRNTAEVRRRMERAVGLALGEWITPIDLFPERGFGSWRDGPSVARLSDARDAAEKREIERALALHDGQLLKTSKTLGISRTTLWEKMKRHGIDEDKL